MSDSANPYYALLSKASEDDAFREALIKDPKGTLQTCLGTSLPEDLTINVVTSKANELTLVIPPKLTDELSDDALDAVAGGSKGSNIFFSFYTFGVGCAASAIKDSVQQCEDRFGKM